ncbi:hypothetical protein HOY80DRAFT_6083 [Tuber brumale]|nr:hypothetical protein HOY80DRAFT_6083 [Tuber brumale]
MAPEQCWVRDHENMLLHPIPPLDWCCNFHEKSNWIPVRVFCFSTRYTILANPQSIQAQIDIHDSAKLPGTSRTGKHCASSLSLDRGQSWQKSVPARYSAGNKLNEGNRNSVRVLRGYEAKGMLAALLQCRYCPSSVTSKKGCLMREHHGADLEIRFDEAFKFYEQSQCEKHNPIHQNPNIILAVKLPNVTSKIFEFQPIQPPLRQNHTTQPHRGSLRPEIDS